MSPPFQTRADCALQVVPGDPVLFHGVDALTPRRDLVLARG
jgi:hypothetical protein